MEAQVTVLPWGVFTVNGTLIAAFVDKSWAWSFISSQNNPKDFYIESLK